MKRLVSGIQPSGILHLGNYLGALKQFVEMQNEYESFVFIADLHAITVPQDPKLLRHRILSTAATYLAAGLDPKKTVLFQQSAVDGHAELGWILTTISTMGEMSRMTQFKDKTGKTKQESIGTGLFVYPALMAGDILLYDADIVPIGEDQKQHVELTRNLAEKFNKRFGKTFKVPEPRITRSGARIMGLDDPEKKMSKSATSPMNFIELLDNADTIRKKIARAVTDSEKTIQYDEQRKGLANLMNIYSLVTGKELKTIEKDYEDLGYKEFKTDLAEHIITYLGPMQKKYWELMNEPAKLEKILNDGAKKASAIADKKMSEIKDKVGLSL